jgi:hypothetical protein
MKITNPMNKTKENELKKHKIVTILIEVSKLIRFTHGF